jgi:hypothetical protein
MTRIQFLILSTFSLPDVSLGSSGRKGCIQAVGGRTDRGWRRAGRVIMLPAGISRGMSSSRV